MACGTLRLICGASGRGLRGGIGTWRLLAGKHDEAERSDGHDGDRQMHSTSAHRLSLLDKVAIAATSPTDSPPEPSHWRSERTTGPGEEPATGPASSRLSQ